MHRGLVGSNEMAQLEQYAVSVVLADDVNSDIDIRRLAVTVVQVISLTTPNLSVIFRGNVLEAPSRTTKRTFTRLPCVNLKTGAVYSDKEIVPLEVGDVFGLYTPGLVMVRISPAGAGQVDVASIDSDGSAILSRLATPAAESSSVALAKINDSLEALLRWLKATEQIYARIFK